MTEHILEGNAAESSYFGRQNKNGKAAYRRAVLTLTGSLPLWAMGSRKVVTYAVPKVVTLEVVTKQLEPETKSGTSLSYEEERKQSGWVDPLTLL